jgi:hypothetical protein
MSIRVTIPVMQARRSETKKGNVNIHKVAGFAMLPADAKGESVQSF